MCQRLVHRTIFAARTPTDEICYTIIALAARDRRRRFGWSIRVRVLRFLGVIWTALLGCIALALTLATTIRLLLPLTPWAQPPVLTRISPGDGFREVLPRTPIKLTFDQPMNRYSVGQAIRFEPPISGDLRLRWSDDNQTLTITPDQAFTSNTTYTLTLDRQAQGRWWRTLHAPIAASFHTAQAPTVSAALPNRASVDPNAAIALIFSQPMVPPDRIGATPILPQLQFEPPIAAEAYWIDVYTLALYPTTPLAPATRYRGRIAAGLTNARGAELEQSFTWSWQTRGPTLLDHSPPDDSRWVAPRQPLTLTLSPALDLNAVESSLQITPTISGTLTSATTLSNTQIITFTPAREWTPGQTYDATMPIAEPASTTTWSFTTQPLPGLIGRFPGQGQLLPRGQALRLIFSTPMNTETLRSGLILTPAADDLEISVHETEVRLLADFAPTTAYTLTIPADLTDRNGVPLASDYSLRFLTTPAAPTLALPEITGHFASFPTAQPVAVRIERTNLSALNLTLYALDEATLLRTLNFSRQEWDGFAPERYDQQMLRDWQIALNDPTDQIVRDSLPIELNPDQPLDPGAYYLRIRTPEGPDADIVLIVSRVDLALKQSDRQTLVWAIDAISGEPLPELPLALYRGNALVARGSSNADGIWLIDHIRRSEITPYVVVGGTEQPAVVSSAWQTMISRSSDGPAAQQRYTCAIFTDHSHYIPGATMEVLGIARVRDSGGALIAPPPGTPFELTVQAWDDRNAISGVSFRLDSKGIISGSLTLDDNLTPGLYSVRTSLGDATASVPIQITAVDPPFDVQFETAESPDTPELALRVTGAGVPIAGATVSWRVYIAPEPATPQQVDGAIFVDDEQPALAPFEREGSGVTDPNGRLALPLPEPATLSQTLRYIVTARVQEPGGPSVEATTTYVITPTTPTIGIRLPSRIVTSRERPAVIVLAQNRRGNAASGSAIALEVYRRAWTIDPATGDRLPADTLVLSRRTTTDDQGQATLELPPLSAAEYRIVARSGTRQSATGLWVVNSGYTGWRDDGEQLRVVTDRTHYRPGDVARILVLGSYADATMLLTLEQNGVISATTRNVQASQVINLDITENMAPNTHIGVVLARRNTGQSVPLQAGYANIHVIDAAQTMTLTIAADQPTYAPEATATLTVSVQDDQGQALDAQLILAVAPDDNSPIESTAFIDAFQRLNPSGFITAQTQSRYQAQEAAESAVAASHDEPSRWRAPPDWRLLTPKIVNTGSDGVRVFQATLPATPGRWRVIAYAATADGRFAQAYTTLVTTQPLVIEPILPPFLHYGDRAAVIARIRNTTPVTQTARVALTMRGAMMADDTPVTQMLVLPPESEQSARWMIEADAGDEATFTFSMFASDQKQTATRVTLPVQYAEVTLHSHTDAVAITQPFSTTIALTSTASSQLELMLAPTIRSAVAAIAANLAAAPNHSIEQSASLLLLNALLARDGDPQERQTRQSQARQIFAALDANQNSDGGWGWRPGMPSDTFVTTYVLEAQVTANEAFELDQNANARALAFLRRANQTDLNPNLQAYIAYLFALSGDGNVDAARGLLDQELGADGLAYLALALPPDQANPALTRLLAQARAERATDHNERTVVWSIDGSVALPRSSVGVTALAAQALQRLRPNSPQIEPALQTLLQAWGANGWGASIDSVRCAGALLASPFTAESASGLRLTVNDDTLLDSSRPLTRTQRFQLDANELESENIVRVDFANDGFTAPPTLNRPTLLLAHRLTQPAPNAPDAESSNGPPDSIMRQDLSDPISGATLDPATLRQGQLVRVRLTLITTQSPGIAELHVVPPAAFAAVSAEGNQDFTHTIVTRNRIIFAAADLKSGVYLQSYLARVVATGDFVVPSPQIMLGFGKSLTATEYNLRNISIIPTS